MKTLSMYQKCELLIWVFKNEKSKWGWYKTQRAQSPVFFKHFILIISRISTRKELILPGKNI